MVTVVVAAIATTSIAVIHLFKNHGIDTIDNKTQSGVLNDDVLTPFRYCYRYR